jgi:transmembrane protein EpsG
MKIVQVFTGNYQVFLLIIACIFMGLMARWIYRYSASPCTSYILFSTLFYSFYAITGHRQTIATALIVFVGYDLIKQRKFWKFLIVAFVALLIHKSALVFVPMYFITRIPVTTGYKILCAAVGALIVGVGKKLYGPIALWIGYNEGQINSEVGGAELYATLLILLCLIIWFLYPRIRTHRNDAQMLFHINTLSLLSGFLALQNQNFMRIQQYFSLFLMITVPEMINTVRKEYRLLLYMLFGMIMIAYLIRNNPHYQFFFLA